MLGQFKLTSAQKYSFDAAQKAAAEFVAAIENMSNFVSIADLIYPEELNIEKHVDSHYARLMAGMADYAWRPNKYTSSDNDDDMTDCTHMADIVESLGWSPYGPWVSDESKNVLVSVQRAGHARWSLAKGGYTTLIELAALAGISEKTMRSATNPKHSNPIRIEKQGQRTFVNADDAYAWLERRGDFIFIGDEGWEKSNIDSVENFMARLSTADFRSVSNLSTESQTSLEKLAAGVATPGLRQVTLSEVEAIGEILKVSNKKEFLQRIYPDLVKLGAAAEVSGVDE